VTPIFDFFVLTTATSTRQMRAIADEVARAIASDNSDRPNTEGTGSSWVLEDFGDVVVHVFSPEARTLYDLEHLWADAVRVDWQAYLEGSRIA
jgi:ribosome-associated protein